MHVGHTAIFQNPNQAVTDYQIYQEDMALAKEVMPELRKLGNEPLFDTEEAAPPAFMAA